MSLILVFLFAGITKANEYEHDNVIMELIKAALWYKGFGGSGWLKEKIIMYWNDIEVWMVGIQITILLVIFEFTLILILKNTLNDDKDRKKAIQTNINLKMITDKCTMFISVLFFLIFNIACWTSIYNYIIF